MQHGKGPPSNLINSTNEIILDLQHGLKEHVTKYWRSFPYKPLIHTDLQHCIAVFFKWTKTILTIFKDVQFLQELDPS